MAKRIRIKVKCCLHGGWVFHTSFHERARGFVCKRCYDFLEANPYFKNQPFKGWGFYPPKDSGQEPDGPAYRRNG